jgi:hypothetical protein
VIINKNDELFMMNILLYESGIGSKAVVYRKECETISNKSKYEHKWHAKFSMGMDLSTRAL